MLAMRCGGEIFYDVSTILELSLARALMEKQLLKHQAFKPIYINLWDFNGPTLKMPKIDTLDALEEHEEHEDDYQTNSN